MSEFVAEEGGDAGYRTFGSEVAPETPDSGSSEAGELSPESFETMDQSGLEALIKQEGLDIDTKGMNAEQIKWAVAEALGFEVVDEGEEGDGERPKEEKLDIKGVEAKVRSQLEKEYGQKIKRLEALQDKARIVDLIEQNPEYYIKQMASHFGVDLGAGTSSEFVPPDIEPKDDESITQFLKRRDAALIKAYEEHQQKKRGTTAPRQGNPNQARTQQVLQYLEDNHPDWALYSDEMQAVLKINPELAFKPWQLYEEAKSARLAKRQSSSAKKIIQRKGESRTGERSTKPQNLAKPRGVVSFDEAWNRAKDQVKRK